jgi:Cu(I)/Ag(I) efflux system periplasmic protein CusF
MNRLHLALVAIAVTSVAACAPDDSASTPPAAIPPAAMPAATAPAPAENRGVGVVQAIDTANATVTIAHEPIATLGWPAMTMAFKVAPPDVLDGVSPGQRIEFTLQGRDMSAVVTSIEPVR